MKCNYIITREPGECSGDIFGMLDFSASGQHILLFFWKKGVEKLQALNHVYSIRQAVIKKGLT